MRTITRTVTSVQSSAYKPQEMLDVACDGNSKRTYTTAKTKSDSFNEKTKKSSAPSPENGANNGFKGGESPEKSDKGVVGLTITTDESITTYVPMDEFHVVHNINGNYPYSVTTKYW